jgi:hypothetical protein
VIVAQGSKYRSYKDTGMVGYVCSSEGYSRSVQCGSRGRFVVG